jgi:nitroimidazol reductase NimA-like FMN-containing flavoprotein (pyridoxamine 5'-phosphate oxidase superfamily)
VRKGARSSGPELRLPRRRDRGKDEAWIEAFLRAAPYGFLAVPGDDGWPHLNSNLFVYDGESRCLYLHTARTGRLRELLEGEQRVTFSAASMGRMLPADEALEFSVEYAGVVVTGRGRVVEDPDEQTRALQALLDRYAPHLEAGRDYRPPVPEELERTAVYRVDIETWSGKEKTAPPDFPGAFPVPEPPLPLLPPDPE